MNRKIFGLLPLFLWACSNDEEAPEITVKALYLRPQGVPEEVQSENYAGCMDKLPPLKEGDRIEAYLELDGKGSELQSFTLTSNEEVVKTDLHYEEDQVTTESNLTDEEDGQLRFKDGIVCTDLSVEATMEAADVQGNVSLTFYLSSKAECTAAQEVIILQTKNDALIESTLRLNSY